MREMNGLNMIVQGIVCMLKKEQIKGMPGMIGVHIKCSIKKFIVLRA